MPPKYMVLLIIFTAELISRMANKDGKKILMQLLTGQPVDVSVYMDYHFWQLVITEDYNIIIILLHYCSGESI